MLYGQISHKCDFVHSVAEAHRSASYCDKTGSVYLFWMLTTQLPSSARCTCIPPTIRVALCIKQDGFGLPTAEEKVKWICTVYTVHHIRMNPSGKTYFLLFIFIFFSVLCCGIIIGFSFFVMCLFFILYKCLHVSLIALSLNITETRQTAIRHQFICKW